MNAHTSDADADPGLEPSPLDLRAYYERLGLPGPVPRTAEGLRTLHRAHAAAIPFENLDIHLGRPIRIDLPSVEAKLVRGRRGGYCFEQNALFAAVLEAHGWIVHRWTARVRVGPPIPRPRTHMMLAVETEAGRVLCDVGFGAESIAEPMPLDPGRVAEQGPWRYRLVREEGRLWVLQLARGAGWEDQYAFTEEPQIEADYEMANFYTSTYPGSRFRTTITAQRNLPGCKLTLRNLDFTVDEGQGAVTRRIEPQTLGTLLRERFDLHFSADEAARLAAIAERAQGSTL